MDFSFCTVPRILFGPGCLGQIGDEVADLGSRAYIVTGRSFLRRTGRLEEVEASLRKRSLKFALFDQVSPEPSLEVVEAGIAEFRALDCDVVVAIGGGSAIDVGKAIAALSPAPGTVREYFSGRDVETKGRPFIAVPTTAGSGAEVTPNAVLVDEKHNIKASIRSSHILPDIAIIDPELMITLPADITAQSGMDALCQAVEAYVSKGATPLTDALAGDAAVRLLSNLPLAYVDGEDIELRTQVALGSLTGAMAFSNARLGLVHGMAHPLGAVTGLPHGLICALLLPYVISFNVGWATAKYAKLARMAGVSGARLPDDEAASALVDMVEQLNAKMSLSERRPELRVDQNTWPIIVSQTLESGSTKSNPRPVAPEDVRRLLGQL